MEVIKAENGNIAVFESEGKFSHLSEIMDTMAEAASLDCFGIVVQEKNLPDGFFDLRNGMAGEVLQKFSNYRMKIAISGNFRHVTSRALQSFIVESNRGRSVLFCDTVEQGIDALFKAL